jgi:hypothetical protein
MTVNNTARGIVTLLEMDAKGAGKPLKMRGETSCTYIPASGANQRFSAAGQHQLRTLLALKLLPENRHPLSEPAEPRDQRRPVNLPTRHPLPFSAPRASVISDSRTSYSTARTSAHRNSPCSVRRTLTSINPDVPCFMVIVCNVARQPQTIDIRGLLDGEAEEKMVTSLLQRAAIHGAIGIGLGHV